MEGRIRVYVDGAEVRGGVGQAAKPQAVKGEASITGTGRVGKQECSR